MWACRSRSRGSDEAARRLARMHFMNAKELSEALRDAALKCPDAKVIVGWSYASAPVEFLELSAGLDGPELVIEADLSMVQRTREANDKARLDWLEEHCMQCSGRTLTREVIDAEMARVDR